MKKYILITLAFSVFACAPKLKSNIETKLEPLPKGTLIVVLEQTDNQDIEGQLIGEVSAKDNGFSVNCGYYQNINNLKEVARNSGANLVKITQEKQPSKWSSCFRIWGKIYKVDDPKVYETKIEWSDKRRLVWSDFKGTPDTEAHPNTLAITNSGFGIESSFNPFKASEIIVHNTFNTFKSWGIPEHMNDYVLRHEQIHFDITEIFTRKLRKTLFDNNLTSKDITRAKALFESTFQEYKLFQERYDADTQKGEKKDTQEKWEAIVEIELAKYDAYKT
ncbi:hypothetical protein BTO05_03885 [Winogradskyella sp. PC-19]|uniref:hypothetical protein n=1 Tax=unclassified Winogradskyella TaxID=2615021 RepID=UPI000B3D473E|nr:MULTISPECIES: hypothetical protein [unclassified Winogradskyella]ARV08819.1 hypothetical protein BTO05_03885 [Winogradskyella sp. PC-19]